MKKGKQLILFSLFVMNLVDQPAPEVTIEQGTLSGKISPDGSFFEYLGIPYASTSSETRFQAPQPPPKWDGVFKATEEIYQCPQNSPIGVVGMEDCLKINVYVPAVAQKPLPVMVYIHGGGFIMGSGGKIVLATDFIVKRDVIVVTLNYRLGLLGFLCLGIPEAPGNAGLKDQIAALKWVKKNIAAFGGDPNNVTVFGHSAGGASVALLLASDATVGLFEKAMVLSASSLAHWAVTRNPVTIASKIAKLIGNETQNPRELYDLFSKMSYKDMISATSHIPMPKMFDEQVLTTPCIEKKFPGEEAVFTDLPFNMLIKKPKNISIIYGSTDKEGLFFISGETDESLKLKDEQKSLLFDDIVFKSEEEEIKVAKEVKEYYFGNESISMKTLMNLAEFNTDIQFEMPMLLEAEIMARSIDAPVYNYYFSYSGNRNLVKQQSGFKNVSGACHGDDIFYMFNTLLLFKANKADQKVINWMTELITNFAKYGDPTPVGKTNIPVRWLSNNKEELRFLYIDKELKMGSMPKPKSFQFWKNIYHKYRKR